VQTVNLKVKERKLKKNIELKRAEMTDSLNDDTTKLSKYIKQFDRKRYDEKLNKYLNQKGEKPETEFGDGKYTLMLKKKEIKVKLKKEYIEKYGYLIKGTYEMKKKTGEVNGTIFEDYCVLLFSVKDEDDAFMIYILNIHETEEFEGFFF
jgi:hypothetical protein